MTDTGCEARWAKIRKKCCQPGWLDHIIIESGMTRSGFVVLKGYAHEGYQYQAAFDTLDEAIKAARDLQKPSHAAVADYLEIYDVRTNQPVFESTRCGYGINSRWEDETLA